MFGLKEDIRSAMFFSAIGLVALAVCLGIPGLARALGTPAGTVIANTAVVNYTLGSDPTPLSTSVSNSFSVLEIIDAVVVWQDGANVAVNSPHDDQTLTFLLTNTGNGPEVFTLTADSALAGDRFDPGFQRFWLETNGQEGLQTMGPTPDTLYQPGVNEPDLAADGAMVIYLVSDIPADLEDGATGHVRCMAAATTAGAAGAASGTLLAGAGTGGIDAVVGLSHADADAVGTYVVSTTTVRLEKSIVRIVDPDGGDQPYTGARITYRLTATVSGSGTVTGLTLSDTLPAEVRYEPASILLDGAPQTDAHDPPADASDFNVTRTDTVTVHIGDTTAPAVHVIEFSAIIN